MAPKTDERNSLPLSSQSMSSHLGDSVSRGRVGRWGAPRPLSSATRSRSAVHPGLTGAHVGRHRVSGGDDRPCLDGIDRAPIDVPHDVGLATAPAGDDPGEQGRGDVAERRGVVLARLGHQPVIARRQRWIEPPGVVGGEEERLAQDRITALRRATMTTGLPGRVERGDQAAEGPGRGQ